MSVPFDPATWSDAAILIKAQAAGIDLPPECLQGVKANLALLADRWAIVAAALREEDL